MVSPNWNWNWIWSGSLLWPSGQSSFVLPVFAFAETIASRNEQAPSPTVPVVVFGRDGDERSGRHAVAGAARPAAARDPAASRPISRRCRWATSVPPLRRRPARPPIPRSRDAACTPRECQRVRIRRRKATRRFTPDTVLPASRDVCGPALPEHRERVDVDPPVAIRDDADLVLGARREAPRDHLRPIRVRGRAQRLDRDEVPSA